VLLQTFSPAAGGNGGGANNMTSWLAAESDYTKTSHPKLVSVQLPSNANVLGTLQFDNNINNDPKISPQISLLGQHGSKVVLGNVIVLPFANHSFLYVRPLYVEATGSSGGTSFPQLQDVIVGTQTNVAMASDFQSALQALFATTDAIPGLNQASAPPQPGTPSPSPGVPTSSTSFPSDAIPIVNDLLSHERAYEQALAKGDFAAAGTEQAAIKADAAKLQQLLASSATPAPSPAP
jgi:uncharacterized membrane protein (UPF0182 family)